MGILRWYTYNITHISVDNCLRGPNLISKLCYDIFLFYLIGRYETKSFAYSFINENIIN